MIVDRDKQELDGLEWLISKYSFPISSVGLVDQLSDMLGSLENELPDVLCLELDMIPDEKWLMVKKFIDRYVGEVIAVTAEPTFEKATQAIEMGAVDLWVKPLSPSRVKNSLQLAFRKLTEKGRQGHEEESKQSVWYESLFIDEHIPYRYPVYLLKTEASNDLSDLRTFIEQFDFYLKPLVFSTSDRIALIFEEQFPEPIAKAQRFLEEWERATGKALVIAVDRGGGEASLHGMYKKLRKVMEITFFTGYQQVLCSDDQSEWRDMDPFLTLTEQRDWVVMLDEGRSNDIKTWLYDQFYNIESPYPDPGLLRTRLTSILAQVRRFMIRKGMTDYEEKYKRIFDTILYSPVLYRIVQDFILFINDLLHSIEEAKHGKVNVVEEAIAYVEEHFHEPELSLKRVASHVNRNPSYLSHTLSTKYGQSFREVVNAIRIQKAKEMLTGTKDTIQAIAHATGFTNANYFSRVFKEVSGETPGEYRKLH
ncbi:helix-turn-helix domain-containing protein [Guptibacillus algicola]|uniref:helix-turn-helix domain-containing protein n=1 Tax=Guptibacillus algicola TaxID=225844 RepID=UPI001CD5C665|nr:helix-turn-helix domain-containing protein [Alkalihalobacillus algicola]MCA0988578.1 helix-turn-helix domain-containing protein [Alkalihalobacillus algicola]